LGEEQIRQRLTEALKKHRSFREKDPRKQYAALVRFGLGRGYSYAQIVYCLGKINESKHE